MIFVLSTRADSENMNNMDSISYKSGVQQGMPLTPFQIISIATLLQHDYFDAFQYGYMDKLVTSK